ncbi:MAG TPA: type II toxin-antitoxin system RelE/ParE family toxin [Bacteroidia bacterium]|nr:type II toxin-antitoxin system RelE/ParE family toxin [Bacteroidia bacterium]
MIEVGDAAAKEIETAFVWYESEQEKLGMRFLTYLNETFTLISDFPHSFPIKIRNYHECYMGNFPFIISYQIEGRKIIVHSVFHTSRKPSEKK